MYKIVLLRHGESTWYKENRFTVRAARAAVAGQGRLKA